MRSQILPPVLCFLLAALCSSTPSYSAIKLVDFKAKESVNKGVKNTKAIENVLDISTIAAQSTPSIDTPEKSVLNAEGTTNTKLEKATFEANSYKNTEKNTSETAISKVDIIQPDKATTNLFLQGLFYGFTIMVILLNVVCFFLFEEKNYLLYSIALTTVAATILFSDNLFPFIGITGIENIGAMQTTLFLIATISSAAFASKFLSIEEFFPKVKWIAAALLSVALVTTFTSWISEASLFTGIANASLMAVLLLYFSAGVVLFSKKNYVKFYVIAFAIPMLFSFDYFVLKNLGIHFLFTESVHLKVATTIEMLIITYAVMYRMGAIKEEHVIRQTEMRIFLQRQEVINRSNTEKIMQDMYLENLIMQYDLDGLEIKLLQYISEGKDNAKIARKLKTTEPEIEELTKELYFKLDIGEQVKEDYRMVETQPDYIYN
ncbi:7TM-DISM domain-containing protein [Ulvibacter litoralis]|uniref:7TM diverse intracellular signalling n=1 Tax=Ulvibacter litoralis TaxID=227084 RepID=A0A1G7F750_9FLAO|nr:7TM-DISM domain-containing protein [Ulvibacter litoralis]GHC52394.1 hypothetical protein GCM10008083_15290 [Ulvibacter litoralis]SDE71656.1 7TM diverse intracellular signalling [Ulvibacter litoralis]